MSAQPSVVQLRGVSKEFGQGHVQALTGIDLEIRPGEFISLIGPSGCGKSTLLRCLNRMNDLIDDTNITGSIKVHDQDIYAPKTDVIDVRRRIGMVFQKSNPFPKSIYENVVYGLRIAGIKEKAVLDEACERSLKGAALWDEVRTGCTRAGSRSRAARCSASASRGRSRWSPRSC